MTSENGKPCTSKSEILAALKRAKVEELDIPDLGLTIFIRVIKAGERDAFESSLVDAKGRPNVRDVRARFAALVISDADGNPIFNVPEVAELTKGNAKALDRIWEKAKTLNGMLKDVDGEKKESGPIPVSDSS